jgi:hypothetical protein
MTIRNDAPHARAFAVRLCCALLASALGGSALAAGTAESAAPATGAGNSGKASQSDVHLGLTIVGDRETPLGLFITPWKNAYPPERGDRPVLLLDETAQPLDADTFQRQSMYDEAFSTYRQTGAIP